MHNNKNERINTKSAYDSWALIYDFPLSEELEEKGFNDFKWLFDIKDNDYLYWVLLKKLCKEYQNNYGDVVIRDLYSIIENEYEKILPISML